MTDRPPYTAENASRAEFLPVLRALARAYHAFLEVGGRHIRSLGLTGSQFDVIATLGNTPGMPLGELAQRTLITKSSLTGIVDRLEHRGLVERCGSSADRRCVIARLTPAGDALFREAFPAHITYMHQVLEPLTAEERDQCRRALERLRSVLEKAPGFEGAPDARPGGRGK